MFPAKKSDAQIQKDVLHELAWDTRVDETDVGVSVRTGTVTLTGTVTSWGKRLAAQEAAHRVAGVLDVANELQVKPAGSAQRDDTDIAKAIRFTLHWDVTVPDAKITTTVSSGIVTLEGEVDLLSERDDAERAVRNLAGVCEVRNHVRVVPSQITDDVKSAIELALARHAARESRGIGLMVHDGVVTVSGCVQSWAEKQLVLGAAKGTVGVKSIEDDLSIGG